MKLRFVFQGLLYFALGFAHKAVFFAGCGGLAVRMVRLDRLKLREAPQKLKTLRALLPDGQGVMDFLSRHCKAEGIRPGEILGPEVAVGSFPFFRVGVP